MTAWRSALAAALLGIGLTCAAFYPGWASADSLQQYLTATGRLRLDDVHPPLMAGLWWLTDKVIAGSGGLFLLFVAAWWGGLVASAWALFARPWQRWLATAVIGFWPAALLMLAHVWKDVGMVAALLVATAAILRWHAGGGRASVAVALLALVLACGFRHNGVFAAWPLLVWLCWPRAGASSQVGVRVLAVCALSLVLAATPATIARLSSAARGDAWTVVALWDVGAISAATGQMLMPPSLVMPDLTADELRAGYVPYANPPIFGSGKLLLSLFVPYDDAQRAAVRAAWWDAVRAHPDVYLAHRAALSRHLLFGYDAALPHHLVYVPDRLVPADPPVLSPPPADDRAVRAAAALWTTPLFAGALYLALAALALAGALRRSRRDVRVAVVALAASAWANAAPLALIAGSAEFRYLLWTVPASLLALLAAWLPRTTREG